MDRSVRGRKVVVVGFGASGAAAARLCMREGASDLVVNDRQEAADLGTEKVLEVARQGVRLELGGHRPETFARAELIVLSPGVAPPEPVLEAEARGVPVVSEIELASWFIAAPLVAITGTNGKSTVTTLVGEMLKASGIETFLGGNLGVPLSDAVGSAAARAPGVCVVEVSSFQLERVFSFRPRVAVLLNLTPDHLDRYASLAEYAAAKARVFLYQRRSDHAVVPGDDPLVLALARAGAAQVHSFGGENSEVRIEGDHIVDAISERYPLAMLRIRGTHNVGNAMAAILTAQLAGGAIRAIRKVLAAFQGLAHRMQLVLEDDDVVYYDDSKATNVGAAVKALEGMERRVVLIAGGRDKGGSYDPLVQLLRAKARAVVLLGEAAPLLRAALGGSVPVRDADDMFDAVRIARRLARPGDCVLLAPACSSLDMFESYAERGRVYSAAVRAMAGTARELEDP